MNDFVEMKDIRMLNKEGIEIDKTICQDKDFKITKLPEGIGISTPKKSFIIGNNSENTLIVENFKCQEFDLPDYEQ